MEKPSKPVSLRRILARGRVLTRDGKVIVVDFKNKFLGMRPLSVS